MAQDQEHEALDEALGRMGQAIVEADANLEGLPYGIANEALRETMEQLTSELHRMEENLQAMLKLGEDIEIEGGTENGSN